jgi:hypothetical protein
VVSRLPGGLQVPVNTDQDPFPAQSCCAGLLLSVLAQPSRRLKRQLECWSAGSQDPKLLGTPGCRSALREMASFIEHCFKADTV